MELLREGGIDDVWPVLLGNVAMNLGVCPRAIPKPNEQDPDVYLDSHMQGVGFEVFPHLNRYPRRPDKASDAILGGGAGG